MQEPNQITIKKQKGKLTNNKRDFIFSLVMLAFPLAQFFIFYIGVNFNSVMMAFKEVTIDGTNRTVEFAWFKNFKTTAMFGGLTKDQIWHMVGRSVTSWIITVGFNVPLGLLFSFYIYKKLPMAGAFRIILFLPQILSAAVMAVIYVQFVDNVLPSIIYDKFGWETKLNLWKGLTGLKETRYPTVMFFNVFISFGASVLMYANAMSGIAPEVIESAHLDGATGFKEFWHICLPMIFSTVTIFLYTGVATIFTGQINLYSFFQGTAKQEVRTMGYYLYMMAKDHSADESSGFAALGVLLTLIAVPLTLGVKGLLEKVGSSEE